MTDEAMRLRQSPVARSSRALRGAAVESLVTRDLGVLTSTRGGAISRPLQRLRDHLARAAEDRDEASPPVDLPAQDEGPARDLLWAS
jgi:hypothetical protein